MKPRRQYFLVLICIFGLFSCREKPEGVIPYLQPPPGDQLSQGLWWLYHAQYPLARKTFTDYSLSHPKDPRGYFYRTATDWWQLAQDTELASPALERQFENNYQNTIRVSQVLFNETQDPKLKAIALLCEGGALGLRGRWSVIQKEWGKAYSLGKKGYKLLKQALIHDPELYDAYLGLGIYDYYTATLSGVKGFFAKLVMHGNRERGLEELEVTVKKAHHARVEAMLFLIQIQSSFEKSPAKALPLAQQLVKEFPSSPVMHMAKITTLFEMKEWDAVLFETQDFLQKCQNRIPFYSHAGLSPARYFYGLAALWGKHDPKLCLNYMNKILAEENPKSQWVSFAYLRRGQAYDMLGQKALAKADYKTVMHRKNIWNSHKEASRSLTTSSKSL